jgi:hypothetical protein
LKSTHFSVCLEAESFKEWYLGQLEAGMALN